MNKQSSARWITLLVMVVCLCTVMRVMAQNVNDDGKDDAKRETVTSLIVKGGPVMIPIGIFSVLALAIAVERLISMSHDKIIPPNFISGLRDTMPDHPSGDTETSVRYCERHPGPVGTIFRAGLMRLSRGEEAVEKAIEDAGSREADKLKRSVRGLSVIATVSPLLGLLGTVYGMISAFQTAAVTGTGKGEMLAEGIYEALVTTAAGLTVAIPTLLVYQYFNNKTDSLVDEIDEMGIEFMSSCMGNNKR